MKNKNGLLRNVHGNAQLSESKWSVRTVLSHQTATAHESPDADCYQRCTRCGRETRIHAGRVAGGDRLIVILVSLLLPAVARAKAHGKRVKCINNQKQLAMTWLLYASDNADSLPSNGLNDPPNPNRKLWVQGNFFDPNANRTNLYVLNPAYALFANYIKSPEIYVCATDRQVVKIGGVEYPKVRSYSMNVYLGWLGPWDWRLPTGYRVFLKQSQIVRPPPTDVFLFMDVNPDSICWPYFGVYMNSDQFFNFPGSPHRARGVISFADGHVETHRWTDQRTITAYSSDYHGHRESSPSNKDIAWLREHTTVKQ